LLADDPHLRFRAPALWDLATVTWPGGSPAGATGPGVPFMVLSQNNHIAWSFTSAETDVQDLFVKKIDTTGRGWYRTPEGSRPFEEREPEPIIRRDPMGPGSSPG